MLYPTLEEVKKADREQLARWYRFLGSPGLNYIDEGQDIFEKKMEEERVIMNLIAQRFSEFGGFTSELSKKIGWIRV